MELKGDSVQGKWETNSANGLDFFIINDAIIQKICILGEDVEPCFEGASVTAPNVSSKFTLDDGFKNTLYSMMQDLRNVLKEGGQYMKNLENTADVTIEETEAAVEYIEETVEEVEVNSEVNAVEKEASVSADYTEDVVEEVEVETVEEEPVVEEAENQYQLLEEKRQNLEQQVQDWKEKYTALETQYQELVNFKNEIDNQRKDALISEFYMLSEEDKAEVIENKEKYTLDEIKAKLSVICFDKKINFALNEEKENASDEAEVITYSLEPDRNLPEWVKAVKEQEKNN